MSTVLWMVGALLSFCLMAVAARELSGELALFQVLSIRSMIGLGVITGLIFFNADKSKRKALFLSRRIKMQIGRNVFHFAGQYGWFVGIGLLPLAEVFAIEFTAPIWTILIAAVLLKEALTARKVFAVLLGVLGVYITLRSEIMLTANIDAEMVDLARLLVLAAAICFAFSYVTTKSLSRTDKPLTILFYMCLLQLPMGLLLAGTNWVAPNSIQWLWLCVVSLTALTAHYCITRALMLSEAGIVITLDFLRLPLIAIVGILFYGEAFNLALLFGAGLMLTGNLINVVSVKRP